ncbi:MAG TPA: RedB protein [Thermoanaerobaculia bacterium]|nr:RedB protein [Thermoanaerobaculia bacterium]
MKRRLLILSMIAAAALWVTTIAAAYEAIRRFETTPGLPASAPRAWPAATSVARTPGTWSLVMLVHPHCSCSRASVQELAEVVEKAPRDVQTTILVYRPHEMAAAWERTAVYNAATRVRRARVMLDADGAQARVFGGFTSGQTFLYDGEGRLRFAGGVTSLRGHAGLNRGRADILRIANTRSGEGSHPVFGCAITTTTSTRLGETR